MATPKKASDNRAAEKEIVSPLKREKDAPSASSALRRLIAAEHVESISGRMAILTLIATGFVLHEVQTVLLPFVIAGITAYVATPLVTWTKRRTGLPRAVAAVGVFFLLVAAVAVMAKIGLPPLFRASMRLATDLQGTLERQIQELIGPGPVDFLGQQVSAGQLAGQAVETVRGWLSQGENMATLVTVSFTAMIGIILTVVMLCYFLIGGPSIASGLFWLVPPKQRVLVEYIGKRLDPALKRYFIGLAIVVLYAICAAYVGLGLVLGLRHAVFLAVLTGILEIVPFFGPVAAAVIAGLVAIKHATSIWSIVAYAIYATVLRLSIDQVVAPLVLGRAGRVHPVLVIFCFLTGGALFGFAGVLLAVPVALTVKVVLETLYAPPEDAQAGH
jgi:predicted PurR-regulated permease PerM